RAQWIAVAGREAGGCVRRIESCDRDVLLPARNLPLHRNQEINPIEVSASFRSPLDLRSGRASLGSWEICSVRERTVLFVREASGQARGTAAVAYAFLRRLRCLISAQINSTIDRPA